MAILCPVAPTVPPGKIVLSTNSRKYICALSPHLLTNFINEEKAFSKYKEN